MSIYQKLLIFLVLVFMLSGCASGGAAPTPTMANTPIVAQKPTYTVQRGDVVKSLQLGARVVPVRQQDLFFRTDGYVKEVFVKRGDTVKAGMVLAELETGDLAIQLAEAELALKVAEAKLVEDQQASAEALIEAQMALEQANLSALQAGALGVVDSMVEAETNVTLLEAKFKKAELLYQQAQADRAMSEFDKGERRKAYEDAKRQLENAKTLLEAEKALAVAQDAMDSAKEAYSQAQSDESLSGEEKEAAFEAFNQATSDYVSAWLAYAQALGGKYPLGYAARKAGMDAALAKMKVEKLLRGSDPMLALDVEKARLSLRTVQEKIDNTRLVAPFDGTIQSASLAAGSQVAAFREVMSMADPSGLEITAIPTAEELSGLGVSQTATVTLSAQPGKEFAATVRALPVASQDSGETASDPAIHIELDDPSVALTLGEAATVVIQIETRPDVLWLPPAATRTFQGQDFVFIESDGVQRRVNVRLGLKSADRVEILEGLEEGQVVIGQ